MKIRCETEKLSTHTTNPTLPSFKAKLISFGCFAKSGKAILGKKNFGMERKNTGSSMKLMKMRKKFCTLRTSSVHKTKFSEN